MHAHVRAHTHTHNIDNHHSCTYCVTSGQMHIASNHKRRGEPIQKLHSSCLCRLVLVMEYNLGKIRNISVEAKS